MSDEFIKWIGIIGSVASLVGLYYAIKQINKTLDTTTERWLELAEFS